MQRSGNRKNGVFGDWRKCKKERVRTTDEWIKKV
jgi:hypothetical protein